MADTLLDTTLFLDYLSGVPEAYRVLELILAGGLRASVSALTLQELGLHQELTPQARGTIGRTASLLEVAPLDPSIVEQAASSLQDLSSKDQARLLPFAIIAITASQRGETIITRLPEEYKRFGVSVRTY